MKMASNQKAKQCDAWWETEAVNCDISPPGCSRELLTPGNLTTWVCQVLAALELGEKKVTGPVWLDLWTLYFLLKRF